MHKMVEVVTFSKQNRPSPQLFMKFASLTRESTSASSVLNSRFPLIVTFVLMMRRITPDKSILLENRLRKIGALSGYYSRKFIENNVVRSSVKFKNFLSVENHTIFVAFCEDKVIGILCMEPAEETGMAYLHTLHVDPGNRRSGIATSLCSKALNLAKDEGYEGVMSIALVESLGLFIRLGFKEAVKHTKNTFFLNRSL
jgi:N-acetylglutamate synthase-like GNAT family acetyltransferase